MSAAAVGTEAEIWNRTIQPENGSLSPEAAKALLELRLPPEDISRVNELSAKAQDGSIAEDESRELDNYLNVGRTIELLKAKARRSLRENSSK